MSECLVSIICTAFNHERYIRQTLDGFLMQKTSFPYEVLINDDASTDRTAEIIKEYEKEHGGIIKAFYQEENMYSKGVSPSTLLRSKAKSKYVAVCEGDDFWVDENKLQRQVDFLEAHPDYSLCVHSGYYAYENGVLQKNLFKAFDCDKTVTTEEMISGWLFPTASLVYRRVCKKSDVPVFRGNCPVGDYPTMIDLSLEGKVYYFNKPMSAYRRMSVSSVSAKVSKDPSKQVKHNYAIIEMLRRLNAYTEGKYIDAINKTIDMRLFTIATLEHDIDGLKKTKKYQSLSVRAQRKAIKNAKVPNPIMQQAKAELRKLKAKIKYRCEVEKMKTCKIPNVRVID
ncbi:MAG: glycosyltransferase family 2 protein [Clostridia bacterium]|nr:glycosyltransferase family 2 protein [Clostridia bacterium]